MNGVQSQACAEGGENVGWIEDGDWMEYSVNIPAPGRYVMEVRVACDTEGGAIQILENGVEVGRATVSDTGGWQDWATVSSTLNFTDSGPQTLRLKHLGGEGYLYNINWFQIHE